MIYNANDYDNTVENRRCSGKNIINCKPDRVAMGDTGLFDSLGKRCGFGTNAGFPRAPGAGQ